MNMITLLIVSLFFIWNGRAQGEHQTLNDFLLGKKSLGIATGTAIILVYWITGNTLLAAPEAVYQYGILGDIGYALMGGVGLLVFAPVAKAIKTNYKNVASIGDFFYQKYQSITLKYLLIVMTSFHLIGIIATQAIGGGKIIEYSSHLPYELSILFVFLTATLSFLFGGFQSIVRVGLIQVMVILCVALLIPPFNYLKYGAVDIYQHIKAFQPVKLDLGHGPGQYFLMGGLLSGIGAVFMDQFFWQRAHQFKKQVVAPSLSLSAVIWIFVPLSFGSLAFIVMANEMELSRTLDLIPAIVQISEGTIIRPFLLVAVWSALISTTGIALNSLTSLVMNYFYPAGKELTIKKAKGCMVILAFISFIISLLADGSMLELLLFFGVVNTSVIFPTIFSLFRTTMPVFYIYMAIILASFLGIYVYFTEGSTLAILISGLTSSVVCILGFLHGLIILKQDGNFSLKR